MLWLWINGGIALVTITGCVGVSLALLFSAKPTREELERADMRSSSWPTQRLMHLALNGRYRSNADKQRAVQAALKHIKSSGLSDNQIAKHCGVTHQTIANWREKLTPSFQISKIATREVTRNGTTYQQNTANIGRKAH